MKYIQKLSLSPKTLLPASIVLGSIFLHNNPIFAYTLPHITFSNTSKSSLPSKYATPAQYYASLPFPLHTISIRTEAIAPLSLHLEHNGSVARTTLPLDPDGYITISGTGSSLSGNMSLDSLPGGPTKGLKAFKLNMVGNITSTEDTKLITIKESTIAGNISLAGGNNTVMLNYSTIGTTQNHTISFTDPNDSTSQQTVSITAGTGDGNITTGSGDDVVWIGGKPKDGFDWTGQGTGYNGATTVYGDIRLGDGKNELQVYERSIVQGNITLGAGADSVTINNATIGLIIKDYYTNESILPTDYPAGLIPKGNLNIGNGNNTINILRSEIAGTVTAGTGDDSINLSSSTIYGELAIQGGKNTLTLDYVNLIGGLNIAGNGDNSIEIKGGFIGKKPQYNSTIAPGYENIAMGTGKNTLNFLYSEFGGNITGNGTIAFKNGSEWKGDHTIVAGQDVFVEYTSILDGNFTLASDSVTLHLIAGEVNGNLLGGTGILSITNDKDREDSQGVGISTVNGDISVKELQIAKDSTLILNALSVDSEDTTNPNHTIVATDPIQRMITADSIQLAGDILLHPGVTQDSLAVTGLINSEGGAFGLDMNFEAVTADTLDLTSATINGSSNIVYFMPEKPLYYATLGTVLEGVVIGDSSLNVGLSQNDVGGYEYELIRNPDDMRWDLRLVRISASNYAYAGIIENMRNYTKDVWTNVSDHFIQSLIGDNARSINVLPNTTKLPKVMKYGNLNTWAMVNYNSNTIYAPDAPTIEENALTATAGFGITNLTVGDTDIFSTDVFFSYGTTDSTIDQYDRKHTMSMNALTIGITGTWQNLRIGEKHRTFLTVGYWVDMLSNEVDLEGLDNKTQWDTHSMNALASFGYQLREDNITFIASLDGIYTYTKGMSFITKTKNAIDIADDNRFGMRVNTLIGYSLNFGLTPFFQLYVDVPVYSTTKGLITSNGHGFKYDSEKINTSFKFGLNYSIAVGETAITAFLLGGGQKGQPDSSVEVGWSVSAGASINF